MSLDGNGRETKCQLEKAYGAFLAAAVGDALGWPQEIWCRRAANRPRRQVPETSQTFHRWEHRAGGRFFPHGEPIRPGEYSDDTQLLLATARSLTRGVNWWNNLTMRELPMWLAYERGGGGATKRAAKLWLKGASPWSDAVSQKEKAAYFDAGGNGVAMRVMPHCLNSAAGFRPVAAAIVANGLATHGHPRALVGATGYGYAVWVAFREQSTLRYGSLIEETISARDVWGGIPELSMLCRGWSEAASSITHGRYEQLWHDAVDELVQMLEQCHTAMKQGALAIDEEVLHAIGCFNSQVSGSGTVAAAAAVFLASRFAADPKGGLLEAASAVGADTDTIASMTGALLGAVGGYEWLGELAGQVQDAHYLKAMAESIWRAECGASGEDISATRSVRESDLRRITCVLEKATPGMDFLLPDGRGAKLVESQSLTSRCGKNQIISWRVESTDGQTLYIKKMSRTRPTQMLPGEGQGEEHGKDGTRERTPSAHAARVWFRLLVRNLEASRAFYHEVLGLRIIDALPALINLEGAIALVPLEYEKELPAVGGTMAGLSRQGATILCLGVKSLDMKCKGVRDSGACIVTSISSKGGQRFFRCLDPDGNVVEVFEMK